MAAISRNTHMCVTYHGQTIILAKPSTYEELMNAVREGFALCHHAGLTLMVKSPLDGDDEEMELPESARDSLSAMTLTEIIVDECLMGCGQGFGDEDDWGQDLSETEMAAEALQWDRALRSRGSLPPGEGLPLDGPQYPANPQLSSNSEHPANPQHSTNVFQLNTTRRLQLTR